MSQLKKGGLGRGLGALLKGVDVAAPVSEAPVATADTKPDVKQPTSSQPTANSKSVATTDPLPAPQVADDSVLEVPIGEISRGTYQPRQYFDDEALQELADSIAAQGLIQPVLLRKRAGGYELIAGERRWRAAKMIGLHHIPAIVREMDDSAVAAVTLIENIQREDLNPLEEARALQRLKKEFGMTHQDVADSVGRSRAAVTNLIRLLDLDERVAEMLATGKLEMGHARALLSLSGDKQHVIALQVYANGLSVRATEALVRDGGESRKSVKKDAEPPRQSSHIRALENDLAEKIGASVSINNKTGNKGTITVSYNSLDELDGILAHIK